MPTKPTDPKKPAKKRVPLGKPIEWTDVELDALSQVTPSDIENAKQAVKKASPLLAKLMDAKPTDREENGSKK
jgi:hypothetical protein